MTELDYVDLLHLKISPKTNLPTKDQKVSYLCSKCNNYFLVLWKTLYKYLSNDKPYICKNCLNVLKFQSYNNSIKGKTIEERLGEEKGSMFRKTMSNVTKGENNPRYNTHLSEETKQKIAKANSKTYVEKFGIEKANELKLKLSELVKGEKNPMFNKPSPQGSGNGWSGWYKGHYFRSLLELSFMYNYPNFKSAEYISVPYINPLGVQRTYHPDFIIDDTIYEVKPSKLKDAPNNICKFNAMQEYCSQHNLNFVIITEIELAILSIDIIKQLYQNKEIIFLTNYDTKFKEKYS